MVHFKLTLFKFYCRFLCSLTIFLILDLVLSATSKGWKKQLSFQIQNFTLDPLKEIVFKKIKYSRSAPGPENFWWGHQQPYNCHIIFDLDWYQEKQYQSNRSRKISCNCRRWDYPKNFGFYSQLDRKNKTWFFTFHKVYVSWIEWDKILISQISPPKLRYCRPEWTKGRTPWEWILPLFKCKSEFPIQFQVNFYRAQKADAKIWVICQVFVCPSWVMILKLSKIVSFL